MKKVYNCMEVFVEQATNKLFLEYEGCKCTKCKNDIMALALNKLPPKYVVTEKGMVFAQLHALDPQIRADIMTAVTEASKRVNANKQHEE